MTNTKFEIEFLDIFIAGNAAARAKTAEGQIIIGNFKETFESSLAYWSPQQYEAQWKGALNQVLREGSPSALITSLENPETANFINWWPIYADRESIVIQNQLLFMSTLSKVFQPAHAYEYVRPYRNIDDEGNRISEWRVSISGVRDFLTRKTG